MSSIVQIFTSIKESLGFSKKSEQPTNTSSAIVTPYSRNLLLKIISSRYGIAIVEVPDTEIGRYIKEKSLEVYSQQTDCEFLITAIGITDSTICKFILIQSKTKKLVGDFEYLKELHIENNEEFLMIEHREAVVNSFENLHLAGPTELQIREKTAFMKTSSSMPPPFRIDDLLFQDDMRKVFITLAQESAYMLGKSPHADKLILYNRQRMHNYIKHHENAKTVLVQLGFNRDIVDHAMKLKADNYKLALDWLIENEESVGYNEDFFDQTPRTSQTQRASIISSARRDSILSTHFSPSGLVTDRINGLLEIVKFYADKDELVYDENIEEMVNMGYDVDVAREALRITRNNVAAAIAHISGESSPSIAELRDGLSPLSTVRKKLLESSEIQLSLNKPEAFALYLIILDNPTQASAWCPHTDTGGLMREIIINYHEHKHISAVNQFNQSRLPISAISAPK